MMEYNNVTLKKTIEMLRQNAERIPGLVFTGAGPPILLCRVKAMAAETPSLRQDPVTERWGDTVPKTIYKPLKSNIYDKVQFFYST